MDFVLGGMVEIFVYGAIIKALMRRRLVTLLRLKLAYQSLLKTSSLPGTQILLRAKISFAKCLGLKKVAWGPRAHKILKILNIVLRHTRHKQGSKDLTRAQSEPLKPYNPKKVLKKSYQGSKNYLFNTRNPSRVA